MGANTLLKYCGEKSDHCKLKGVISINNPWDVNSAMNLMRNKVVEPYLVFSLVDAFLSRKS
jgi:predicted alpha/beta-fold hydrolase